MGGIAMAKPKQGNGFFDFCQNNCLL